MSIPADRLPPVHSGEFLQDDLAALGMSATRFAKHIGVSTNAVTEIINGNRGVSAPMALRLGKAFGTTPQYWLNLQNLYATKLAEADLGEKIREIEPLTSVA